MQAQFGKEVLGTVRLEEARKHKANAKEILADINEHTDKDSVKNIKTTAASEKKLYSELKRSRWTLLRKKESLSQKQDIALQSILADHENLAVCYAMKEEMCDLFALNDYDTALDGWIRWFDAAKQSSVFPLVHFAELKEKRLFGLASHALFPISTGKLEGFNNKIKVAKRIAYGYRDSRFFFTLIRYLSLPLIRAYNDVYIDENHILSAYGKKNLGDYLTRNGFELIYKKGDTALNKGVQYSNIGDTTDHSITQDTENVNRENAISQHSVTAEDVSKETASMLAREIEENDGVWGFRVDKYDYHSGETMHKSHELYQDPMYDDDGELLYPEGEGH